MYKVCDVLPYPLQALHEPAVEAGITLLNEVGLDPGIDHMLAAQCFDEVRSKGGKVNTMYMYMYKYMLGIRE